MKIELNKTRVIDCSHPIRLTARAAAMFRLTYTEANVRRRSVRRERGRRCIEYVAFQKHQNLYYGVEHCIVRNTNNKGFITNIFSFPLLILAKLPNRY
jgi:hypothetical protein